MCSEAHRSCAGSLMRMTMISSVRSKTLTSSVLKRRKVPLGDLEKICLRLQFSKWKTMQKAVLARICSKQSTWLSSGGVNEKRQLAFQMTVSLKKSQLTWSSPRVFLNQQLQGQPSTCSARSARSQKNRPSWSNRLRHRSNTLDLIPRSRVIKIVKRTMA